MHIRKHKNGYAYPLYNGDPGRSCDGSDADPGWPVNGQMFFIEQAARPVIYEIAYIVEIDHLRKIACL